jgi:hypothetical protein
MEQNDSSLFSLEFDHQVSAYVTESAKWSKFLAIVWFVLCGLMAIFAMFAGSLLASSASLMGGVSGGIGAYMGGFITVIYLVMAVITFIPNLFRYQFAVKALRAIRNNDQQTLVESLSKLKSYNKYWGILTIIILAFYILIFVFTILGSLMR